MKQLVLARLIVIVSSFAVAPAFAGRPLATDDAAVADTGQCQIEAWVERQRSDRALVAAPACGVASGVELGAELVREGSSGQKATAAGIAVKWVPAAGKLDTRLGMIDLGLKVSSGRSRTSGEDWRTDGHTLLGLSSLEAAPGFALHMNVGTTRDVTQHENATLLNVAAAWSPAERALFFAEVLANDRSAVFGSATRTAGARWWIRTDTLGIDLTASRQTGTRGTRWSIGFGWYGLFGKR